MGMGSVRRRFLVCFAVAAIAVAAAGCSSGDGDGTGGGREFFVGPDGSDRNDGSRLRPWRTLQYALDTIIAGDTIVVLAGTYVESPTVTVGGKPSAPVTIRNAAGARPVVAGRLRIAADDVVVVGLTVDGGQLRNGVVLHVVGRRRVTLASNEVRGGPGSGIFVGGGARDVSVLANVVHGNGRVRAGAAGIALHRGADASVESNVAYGNRGTGIQVYPDFDRALVNQNTAADNTGAGILVGGESVTSDSATIVNNIVAFNGGQGIRTFWAGPVGVDNVATNNLIFDNGEDDISRAGMKNSENFSVDPLFRDRERHDYRLRRRSPAIGQAAERYVAAIDCEGRPRPQGLRSDLGACER
jgi:parallel beta-helix repeat protein